ncbi:MAG: hypothetical protein H7Z72_09080, partial [Bacteroidetes bacterium]|nr:hypothetical protein [Fibrella sp.]
MKTVYNFLTSHRWLPTLWLMGVALPLQAQLTTPPSVQWQSVIEGGINDQSRVRLAKASSGEYGVLNGTALSYITAAGALKSVAAVEGSVQINTSPVEYAPVLTTAGLAPTADGGFVVLANDATNLYIIKKDVNQNRVWSTVIAPSASQSNGERYAGLDILPTNDGGYHIFATHLLATFLPSLQVTKV